MKRRSLTIAIARDNNDNDLYAKASAASSNGFRRRLWPPNFDDRLRQAVIDEAAHVNDYNNNDNSHGDIYSYAILIALYTLQGIPMGLSASIPFLIQQKIKQLSLQTTPHALAQAVLSSATAANNNNNNNNSNASGVSIPLQQQIQQQTQPQTQPQHAAAANRLVYQANAIFALCSWPFSLKLLWAPIVDACFIRSIGRRKSWLIPVQALAGIIMVAGANFVQEQLGLQTNNSDSDSSSSSGGSNNMLPLENIVHTADGISSSSNSNGVTINVRGVTAYFFALYFLMATQDIAVDGWSLTMLKKKNRGRGPVCNSIGQNLGYFVSFVGFLALNDAESCEALWRPLFRLPSNPEQGLVSLGGFIGFMGCAMLVITTLVGLFKSEADVSAGGAYASVDASDSSVAQAEAGVDNFLHSPRRNSFQGFCHASTINNCSFCTIIEPTSEPSILLSQVNFPSL